jgi:hypothetical protein
MIRLDHFAGIICRKTQPLIVTLTDGKNTRMDLPEAVSQEIIDQKEKIRITVCDAYGEFVEPHDGKSFHLLNSNNERTFTD